MVADPTSPQAPETVPISVRVHLCHAVVETLARDAGIDLLHIKGPALLPGLRPPGRLSTDADVLVRPGQVDRLEAVLAEHGWKRWSGYDSGSAFHHAANWFHEHWGYVDVHASWPGPTVPAEQVYDEFAAGGLVQEIAHVPCHVPNRTAQILILVLHAGRTSHAAPDVHSAWHQASEQDRELVREMAERLRAGTGLAAGLGDIDLVEDDPAADLWRYYVYGGSRLDEWRARLRAAPTRREAAGVLLSAIRVNRDHLAMELGRPPTRREIARRQVRRVRVLTTEAAGLVWDRLRRRGDGSSP